jgi:CO/xanthine dehydrogenase FAD-binding subunit
MSALASGVAPASTGPSYAAPTSVEDVIAAMGGGAHVVAGGTDLIVGSRQGKWSVPEHLVSIHRVESLRGIRETVDGGLWLGALVTHGEIAAHETIRTQYTALVEASLIVGSRATRNVGTVGGNLMNASPAAETSGPLICFGATCALESGNGHREMAVEDLFSGPGRTVAANDELLVSVSIPAPAPGTGSCYARLEYRRQMEIAVVGATAVVTLEGGAISAARVAITSLAPTVRRVPAAEAALIGTSGDRAAADAAAAAAAAAAQPIDDVRAAADYRRAMAQVITRRVIEAAVARAKGETIPIPASASLIGAR